MKKNNINNWNNGINNNELTLMDKIRELLLKPYKLVLVQADELKRLRSDRNRIKHSKYINDLYNHYVTNKGIKTYLLN